MPAEVIWRALPPWNRWRLGAQCGVSLLLGRLERPPLDTIRMEFDHGSLQNQTIPAPAKTRVVCSSYQLPAFQEIFSVQAVLDLGPKKQVARLGFAPMSSHLLYEFLVFRHIYNIKLLISSASWRKQTKPWPGRCCSCAWCQSWGTNKLLFGLIRHSIPSCRYHMVHVLYHAPCQSTPFGDWCKLDPNEDGFANMCLPTVPPSPTKNHGIGVGMDSQSWLFGWNSSEPQRFLTNLLQNEAVAKALDHNDQLCSICHDTGRHRRGDIKKGADLGFGAHFWAFWKPIFQPNLKKSCRMPYPKTLDGGTGISDHLQCVFYTWIDKNYRSV